MSDERITDLILQRLENIERKIDGNQAHMFSNGTNLFFVNVNSVTNSLTNN